MKFALGVLNDFPKKSLGPCPKEGHHEFLNLAVRQMKTKTMSPTAFYSLFIKLYNEMDENIISIKFAIKASSVQD
ncbi:CLUMA_CG002454, isoform A [Clunio marinus]|uniref:CLUMA_CG002454, isoform A n=1 Tax=Clunio marinus TaxID=568069 RepID=A0A1J1HM18_9DIPT|nr:CLUMA_CG002454, isoform A [Clunio marinus]